VHLLGPTSQAAIRVLLTEFRHLGWADSSNAALAIVRAVEASPGGLAPSKAARAAPSEFLAENDLKQADLESMLRDLVDRRRHQMR
jgi:hypothetical protein